MTNIAVVESFISVKVSEMDAKVARRTLYKKLSRGWFLAVKHMSSLDKFSI
jgi:hypothetical protein